MHLNARSGTRRNFFDFLIVWSLDLLLDSIDNTMLVDNDSYYLQSRVVSLICGLYLLYTSRKAEPYKS